MSGCWPSARLAVCAAVLALAAALAPSLLLDEAAAQTDESLPEFNPDGTLLLRDDGNGTVLPASRTYNLPQDVAFDQEGRIYVADRGNNRVAVLDGAYNYSHSIGNIDANRRGLGGTGQGGLGFPAGVALNLTHVFVAERSNNRLSVFTLDGSFVRHISGPDPVPVPGFGTISFNQARGIAVTPEGIAYLSFDASAVPYYYPNGTQKGLLLGANADGMDAGRGGILAVAVPGSSTSGSIVRFLNMSDEHQEVFTIGTVGDSTVEGDFKRPRDVKFSSDGRLLAVADSQNNRIQVFRLNTTDDGRATGLEDTVPVLVIRDLPAPTGVALDSVSHRLAVTGSNPPTLWVYEFALPAVKTVAAEPDPGNAGSAIDASALSAGSSALVNVTFNTDLAMVNTTAGIPYLALGPDRNATLVPYNYSETTRMLQFTYTVQAGDTDADFEYNPDTALRLNGSTITAGPRNVTALTALPWEGPAGGSLWAVHGITIDTEQPELDAIYSPNASAAYTNGSRIVVALNYTEAVWAVGPSASGLPSLALNVVTKDGGGASAPYISGNGTATLSFSYEVQPGDSAPGGLRHAGTGALSAGSVVDAAGNAADLALPDSSDFAGPSIMLDTVQPRVLEVNSTSPTGTYGIGQTINISVTFDEDVTVTGSPALALATAPSKNALYVPDTDGDAELLFRYEVEAGDSAPGGLRHAGMDALSANGSSIVDAAGNVADLALPDSSDFAGPSIMLDTVQPRVLEVNSTSPTGTYGIGQTINISVTFDEDVTVTGSPALALATAPSKNALYVQDTDGDAELLFRYEVEAGDGAPGGLRYAGTGALSAGGSIVDAAGNAANRTLSPPGPLAGQGIWLDAVAPRVVSVEPDSPGGTYRAGQSVDIAVVFDENVTVTGSPALALATAPSKNALYVQDTDGDAELLFRYEVEAGDGAPGGLRYAGTGALSAGGGSIADAVGNAADLTLPAPSPLAGIMINTASMGGGPGNQTGGGPGNQTGGGPGNQTGDAPTTVVIGLGGVPDGQGDFVDRGPGVNVTIDVSGLPGAGTAGGTVQFPQGGATVTASFGSVSFPPGAVATSVPADGLLVLRVVDAADDTLPSNSSIQRGLAYEGSGAVVLQRVVEVGDENTRIEFDKPVRISLEGQAGGRAFYIAGAGGQITPIDDACGADDTDRVDRHLNGTGECRIESDDGEDMVIYTYHLTRFGTVKPASDAMRPPVYYTCSVALEKPDLRIDDARLEGHSTPVSQNLLNTGSAQFERVGIDATRWQANLDADAPPGAGVPSLPSPLSGTGNGTASGALVARVDMSLPAGLTEVREEIEGSAYEAVGEGTTVASGLGGGDDRQLWFKLNLTQYSKVQGETITQSVTYNAQCVEPVA